MVLGNESDGALEILDGFGLSAITNLVDEGGAIRAEFGVVSHPAIVFIEADGTVERHTGQVGPWDMRDRIAEMI